MTSATTAAAERTAKFAATGERSHVESMVETISSPRAARIACSPMYAMEKRDMLIQSQADQAVIMKGRNVIAEGALDGDG